MSTYITVETWFKEFHGLVTDDLKTAALLVSEKLVLQEEFTDEELRTLLEVLIGTRKELEALKSAAEKQLECPDEE